MATNIGTNVVVDEQTITEPVRKALEFLENLVLKEGKDEEQKLFAAYRRHIQLGGDVSNALLKQPEASKIVAALKENNIPYMAVPDSSGQMFVSVRQRDTLDFANIQDSVMSTSTNYAMALTDANMAQVAKDLGTEGMTKMTVRDAGMALVDQQKLFQNGVTFSTKVQDDGSTRFYTSPMSTFSKAGKDIAGFELAHAFEQAKEYIQVSGTKTALDVRKDQARYDDAVLTEFATRISKGDTCTLRSASDNTSGYFECKGGYVEFHENGERTPLLISPEASVDEIKVVLSRNANKIYDMGIINGEYKSGALPKCNRPKISDCSFTEQDGLSAEDAKIFNDRNKILDSVFKDVDKALNTINMEATQRIMANVGDRFDVKTQSELLNMKRTAISDIVNSTEKNPLIDIGRKYGEFDFVSEFVEQIKTNFGDRNQGTDNCVDFSKVSLKDIKKELKAAEALAATPEIKADRDFEED